MSNIKRFVKLEDKFFEVVIDGGMFRLEPVDAMKYMTSSVEKVVLGNEELQLAEDQDNILQQVVEQAQEELIKTLKAGIKDTVLGCLGFEKDSWGGNKGYKVDHCNSRMSSVTNLISEKLKKELLDISFDSGFYITEEEKEELRITVREDFKKQYKSMLSRNIYDYADRAVREDLKSISDDLLKSRKKDIAEMALDSLLRYKPKKATNVT